MVSRHPILVLLVLCAVWPLPLMAQEAEEAAPPPVDTPAIEAIRESNPQTPPELIRAALLAGDLGRADLAKEYLQQLIQADPSPEEMLATYRQLGSRRILRLQTADFLQPEGTEAANFIYGKLNEYLKDPARLQQLVEQLGSAEAPQRRQAARHLFDAGADAANVLFANLADPAQQRLHAPIKQLLVQMGGAMADPLLAALDSGNVELVTHLTDVARQLKLDAATPFLVGRYVRLEENDPLHRAIGRYLDEVVGSRPNQAEVREYLQKRVDSYLDDIASFHRNDAGLVELWAWDHDENLLVQRAMPLADAEVVTAGRLLRDLYALTPADPQIQVLRAVTVMQRMAALEQGEAELAQLVADHGYPLVESALRMALKQRKFALGAIVACQQLGKTQDPNLLIASVDQLPALSRALQSPHYRVRLAAVKAILEIDPKHPYPGSAEMFSALVHFASSEGRRVALFGDLHQKRVQTMAGNLRELNFDPVITPGGKPLFLAAQASSDVEVIFLNKALDLPVLMETVQILRKDRRTADLPIGLIVPSEEVLHLELRTADDPLTHVMVRPPDARGFIFQLQRLYESQERLIVPADERLDDARFALEAMSRLAANREHYGFYDVLKAEEIAVRRLSHPNLTSEAAQLLGHIGTPAAQQALVNYASDPFHPLALRQECLTALETAIEEAGIMLTKDQILAQYDRYNASEQLSAENQEVLGKILDILEAPTQNVRFDQPAVPRE